jgi:hypothetical protein
MIDRDEDGFPDPPYSYPLECLNCGQTAERLTPAPYDEDFLLCDDCMEEALAVATAEERDRYVNIPVLKPIGIRVQLPQIPEFPEVA